MKILFLSDIHLGNRKVSTDLIIESCWDIIERSGGRDLDGIAIPGDLFDRSLPLGSPESMSSIRFVRRLCEYCLSGAIGLAILKGTPSHERGQSALIESLVDLKDNKNIIYIDHVCIREWIGLIVLFVPDEADPTASQTFVRVKGILSDSGIDKVDLTLMHGLFGYQIPIESKRDHDEMSYINICSGPIVIGHDHEPKTFSHKGKKKIITPGSVHRLRFGEEHDKGGVLLSIEKDRYSFVMIRNTKTILFNTIKTKGLRAEDVVKSIHEMCKNQSTTSRIRLQGSPGDEAMMSSRVIQSKCHGAIIEKDLVMGAPAALSETVSVKKKDFLSKSSIREAMLRKIRSFKGKESQVSRIALMLDEAL